MSLAIDFLKEYLTQPDVTQADFARACGMTAPNVSDLLKGDVAISRRNIGKLLRGFPLNKRLHFLAAYLRGEIPEEHIDDITVQITPAAARGEEECTLAEFTEAALVGAFRALPSDTYRHRVLTLMRALRGDEKLRELVKLTVEYLQPPDEGGQLSMVAEEQKPYGAPSAAAIAANIAAGGLAAGRENATPAPSPGSSRSPHARKPRKAG